MQYDEFKICRTVTVKKERTPAKVMVKVNRDAADKAAEKLTNNAFKLWMFFALNQDNFKVLWTSNVAKSWCGVSRTTYYKIFNELVDKGYLVDTGNNNYEFHDFPQNNSRTGQKTNQVGDIF